MVNEVLRNEETRAGERPTVAVVNSVVTLESENSLARRTFSKRRRRRDPFEDARKRFRARRRAEALRTQADGGLLLGPVPQHEDAEAAVA